MEATAEVIVGATEAAMVEGRARMPASLWWLWVSLLSMTMPV